MNDIGWNSSPAKGSTGGILIMWRKDQVLYHNVTPGEVTFSSLFSNLTNGYPWYFSGVYCRGNAPERNLLAVELEHIKSSWGNKDIIGRDFNMVLKRSERLGQLLF